MCINGVKKKKRISLSNPPLTPTHTKKKKKTPQKPLKMLNFSTMFNRRGTGEKIIAYKAI